LIRQNEKKERIEKMGGKKNEKEKKKEIANYALHANTQWPYLLQYPDMYRQHENTSCCP
jgi:plasmid maintenance system killer protein